MTRTTRLFVWSVIAAMALITVGVIGWRADSFATYSDLSERERIKLTANTVALIFCPLWLALGTLLTMWKFARPGLRMADDRRRFTESSLIAAAIFSAGIHLWIAAAAVLGAPPGREFGFRLIEAVTGIFLMVNSNFAAKTSPPIGSPDPGRWTRSTLRTSWIGVGCGGIILVSAVVAPLEPMIWIVAGSTLIYVAAAVLQHRALRRKPA